MESHLFLTTTTTTTTTPLDLLTGTRQVDRDGEVGEFRRIATRLSRCRERSPSGGRPNGFSRPCNIVPEPKLVTDPKQCNSETFGEHSSQEKDQRSVGSGADLPDRTGMAGADRKDWLRKIDFLTQFSHGPAFLQGISVLFNKNPFADLTIPHLGSILDSWGVSLWFFKKPVDSTIWKESHMGRFRNPRYAPEFLEKRLSPSTLPVGATSVLVASYSSTPTPTTTRILADSPPAPCPDPYIPPAPTGPSGPA